MNIRLNKPVTSFPVFFFINSGQWSKFLTYETRREFPIGQTGRPLQAIYFNGLKKNITYNAKKKKPSFKL